MPSQFTPHSSLVFQAANAAYSGANLDATYEAKDQRAILTAEWDWLKSDPDASSALVRTLFPEDIPTEARFYTELCRFRLFLGYTEHARAITTHLWISAIRMLDQRNQHRLLSALAQTEYEFFEVAQGLAELVSIIPVSASFAASWFPSLVVRLGKDGAGFVVWNAIERYCELSPTSACEFFEIYNALLSSEPHALIVLRLIGVLRTIELDTDSRERLSSFETRLAKHPVPAVRHIYLKSWLCTAKRGGLRMESLTRLLIDFLNEADFSCLFTVVCRALINPELTHDCRIQIIDWLQRYSSSELEPQAKHELINAMAYNIEKQGEISNLRKLYWKLILKVQPVPSEYNGTWSRLEHCLVGTLRCEPSAFPVMLSSLCERSGLEMQILMRSGKPVFNYLLSTMAEGRWDKLVANMVFSGNLVSRHFGLFLFDQLGTRSFPLDVLASVSEIDLKIALFAFQSAIMLGEVVARFLLVILPRVEVSTPDTQDIFTRELLLQCKNYPTACLQRLKEACSTSPLVTHVIEQADSYFASIYTANISPLSSMMVPALATVARSQRRANDRKIAEAAEQASLVPQIAKKLQMLYGEKLCSFNDGHLTDPIPTQEHGFDYEFPRLEELDPETMALRRFHALAMIDLLESQRVSNT